MDVSQEEREAVQFSKQNSFEVETQELDAEVDDYKVKIRGRRGRPTKETISPSKTMLNTTSDPSIAPFQIYSSASPFNGSWLPSPSDLIQNEELVDKDTPERRKRGRPRKYDVTQDISVDQSQPKRWRATATTVTATATSPTASASINSVRSIPCFFRHCNFSYKRPNSNITEQSDRPLPLPDKFGSFTVRSCKKHCDQWKKMKADGMTCEVCRGLNIEEGDMLQTYANVFMKNFYLCDHCSTAQATALQLSGPVDDSNARVAFKPGGEREDRPTPQREIQPPRFEEQAPTPDRQFIRRSPTAPKQYSEAFDIRPRAATSSTRKPPADRQTKAVGIEEMTEMEAYLEIERRKLADEVMFLRQQLEFEKSQKETLQKQIQHMYHELETHHNYTTSLENHLAIMQTRLAHYERPRLPELQPQIQQQIPSINGKFYGSHQPVMQVAPEDVALLSDILPTGPTLMPPSPPKK